MDKVKKVVIGIGGVTNGGKTTLASKLMECLPNCTCLNQDDYFWPEDSSVWQEKNIWLTEYNYGNWDCDEAVDFERLVNDIQKWQDRTAQDVNNNHPHILLVEGFLLYRNTQLSAMFDKKIFLTLPYDECKVRRQARTYQPPDPVGYFDGIVWPAYEEFKQAIADQDDIVYLSGLEDPGIVLKDVVDLIKKSTQRC